MSIIYQLTRHPDFIQQVQEQIVLEVTKDRQAKAYSKDGLIEGSVTSYTLLTEPVYSAAEGGALAWNIPFKVTGEATVGFKTADGEYGDDTIDGECEGFVEVFFPDNTLSAEDFNGIVSSVELCVSIESVDVDAKEPIEDPEFD